MERHLANIVKMLHLVGLRQNAKSINFNGNIGLGRGPNLSGNDWAVFTIRRTALYGTILPTRSRPLGPPTWQKIWRKQSASPSLLLYSPPEADTRFPSRFLEERETTIAGWQWIEERERRVRRWSIGPETSGFSENLPKNHSKIETFLRRRKVQIFPGKNSPNRPVSSGFSKIKPRGKKNRVPFFQFMEFFTRLSNTLSIYHESNSKFWFWRWPLIRPGSFERLLGVWWSVRSWSFFCTKMFIKVKNFLWGVVSEGIFN